MKGDAPSGPDSHEEALNERDYLTGDWSGNRSKLIDRGIDVELEYLADHLWNIRSQKPERLASWNRVRGTVNLDLGRLTGVQGLYFHITGLWQAGGNLGAYLGTLASPAGLSSANTFRLDSYWLEKRSFEDRFTVRIGQFAGQDFYGVQHDGASFITEPLGYALGNLTVNYETFDPPSTPAAEMRVVPREHFYVKSMVFAADRIPYAHNPTGFVPQFRGAPMSLSEIGWSPGAAATEIRPFDTVETRRGYSGLYQFGGTFNPGKFASTSSSKPLSGNFVLYGMGSQALWRRLPRSDEGLDLTVATDWSPPDRSRTNAQTTVGLRYNELLPIHRHNTVSFGYVRSGLNYFGTPAQARTGNLRSAEHVLEVNVLTKPYGWLLVQPVVQRFINVGAHTGEATIIGFRSKVDF